MRERERESRKDRGRGKEGKGRKGKRVTFGRRRSNNLADPYLLFTASDQLFFASPARERKREKKR
jgi:hypothetical protein